VVGVSGRIAILSVLRSDRLKSSSWCASPLSKSSGVGIGRAERDTREKGLPTKSDAGEVAMADFICSEEGLDRRIARQVIPFSS
jgi:hypothetical protein